MRKAPQSICTKEANGKCPGTACKAHGIICCGTDNVHRAPEHSYSMEDLLIDLIDRQRAEESALILPHAAA